MEKCSYGIRSYHDSTINQNEHGLIAIQFFVWLPISNFCSREIIGRIDIELSAIQRMITIPFSSIIRNVSSDYTVDCNWNKDELGRAFIRILDTVASKQHNAMIVDSHSATH